MANGISEKLREEIEKSDFTDDNLASFYDAIEGMSDNDIKEFIYVNRDRFKEEMPAAVDELGTLKSLVYKQPDWGVKDTDYEKMFNDPDVLDNLDNYSYDDIKYIAEENGRNPKEFVKELYNAKLEKDRKAIAHGEDEGGWFDSGKSFGKNLGGAAMNLFTPRRQEAIERGEDPSLKDTALDIGEQAAYALPVGRIAGLASRPLTRGAVALGSNAIVPLGSEIADALAYDDNKRGKFNIGDVASGTMVNAGVPQLIKMGGARLSKLTGEKVGKALSTIGEGETSKTLAKTRESLLRNMNPQSSLYMKQNLLKNSAEEGMGDVLTPEFINEAMKYNPEYAKKFTDIWSKLKKVESTADFTPDELMFMANDPTLSKFLKQSNLKTEKQLNEELGLSSYLSNQLGNQAYSNGNLTPNVPGVSSLNKYFEEKEKKETREKNKEAAQQKWKMSNKTRAYLGNKGK